MTFDLEKTIRYWTDGAAYDLETGKRLLEVERFPYALLLGHLAIEKILKALVVKTTGEHAPYTHSLTFLIKLTRQCQSLTNLRNIWNFIWRQDTRMKRKISTKNAQKNLPAKNLRRWRRFING